MWKKIENYYWTLKYLRKRQLFCLLKNRLAQRKRAVPVLPAPETAFLPLWMEDLDACPDYVRRFSVRELQKGQVTLLYESGKPEGRNWEHPDRSHLWNFNLHYLEFLIPLAAAYRNEKDIRYYECFRTYCRRWMRDNREGTGDGWHPYTVSLRLTNLWICMDGFGEVMREDTEFLKMLNDSMYAQYCHLQKRLERHLLGNHYFENLKTVFLGSLYFQEPSVCRTYKKRLQKEIREQILSDGVHYERSLMYHKIILEDVMRAAKAVREKDVSFYQELVNIVKKMTDAAWSLEKGLGHTPLFNDAGDNVAKPLLQGLLKAAKSEFGICPEQNEKRAFPEAGYYCLENNRIKILLDAGTMAPDHMPGHGHCDGLSFELGFDGRPLFVNSGTGQYQGELRSYFRSTAAHNTVVIDKEEQSVCWGEHRVGKRMKAVSGTCGENWAKGSLITCRGKAHARRVELNQNRVAVKDRVRGHASCYLHLAPGYEYQYEEDHVLVLDLNQEGKEICRICSMPDDRVQIHRDGNICSYAPEFGRLEQIQVLEIAWNSDGREHEIQIQMNA